MRKRTLLFFNESFRSRRLKICIDPACGEEFEGRKQQLSGFVEEPRLHFFSLFFTYEKLIRLSGTVMQNRFIVPAKSKIYPKAGKKIHVLENRAI